MSQGQLFSAGETVTWRNSESILTQEACIKRYGTGPFRIACVDMVPDEIHACGCPFDYLGHFCEGQNLLDSVGHAQWVFIEDSAGKQVGQQFSGSWFKRA